MLHKRLLVTGGAGFIGSSFIRYGLTHEDCERIVNLDLLTYAANLQNLASVAEDPRYRFIQGDIRDAALVEKICVEEQIDAIVHFAAETHVDRSIKDSRPFYETNVEGTIALLDAVRKLPHIHFHHISTDEVYGALGETGKFSESSHYRPNSPYAASKAASDHFVRAYAHTYSLSTTLSHCTNNYGPCQHAEKFIPTIILSCMKKEPIPIYGDGSQVRDWIFVEDHSRAVWNILKGYQRGETYDIGGECEMKNSAVVKAVIEAYAECVGEDPEAYLIAHVADRPGHDYRYAIDCAKMKNILGWQPRFDFSQGIKETVAWYIEQVVLR